MILHFHADFEKLRFSCSYPVRQKPTFFGRNRVWYLGQKGTWWLCFSKALQKVILKFVILPLTDQICEIWWNFPKIKITAELGGVVIHKKKGKLHLPSRFQNAIYGITRVCKIWKILGQKIRKTSKKTFLHQAEWRFFSKSQRNFSYVLEG